MYHETPPDWGKKNCQEKKNYQEAVSQFQEFTQSWKSFWFQLARKEGILNIQGIQQ